MIININEYIEGKRKSLGGGAKGKALHRRGDALRPVEF
jgi:hypothetical protein